MRQWIFTIRELDRAAEQLLAFAGDRRIMAFYGEIGAGKTTFIQAICRQLGVIDFVTSPSFAIVNEYHFKSGDGQEYIPVFHLDLFRLKEYQEALDIGIEEYLYSGHYCFVEWPEIIENLLPEGALRIKIEIVTDSKRKILFL